MENKKKRGCNYTAKEKATVVVLVNKYKHILENKLTNAASIMQKRDTWIEVTRQYNTMHSSGVRTWKQLRHLYENIKQRSKNKMPKDNVIQSITWNPYIDTLIHKPINSTEGLFGGILKRQDVLNQYYAEELVAQVQPLKNDNDDSASYDDTASYYAQVIEEEQSNNKDSTKDKYYKTKLRNAKLENRFLINRHKMELHKYKLEIEILKFRLKKLQSQRRVI